MTAAARLFQDVGFAVYAVPLFVLAALTATHLRRPAHDLARVIRWHRRLGPMLGLALGACIFSGLTLRWLETGTLSWHWGPPHERWITVVLLVFIAAWVSNIKLEIWTLEPLRRLDPDPGAGPPPDAAAYTAAARGLSRHLIVHATLLAVVAGLEISRRISAGPG